MKQGVWKALIALVGLGLATPVWAQSASEQVDVILTDWCAAEGYDDAYCACYKAEVDATVRPIAGSDEALLAWSALHAGGSINPMTLATILQSVSPAEQQAAAMLFTQVPDLGASCAAPAAPFELAGDIDGSPEDRFMAVCVADMEDAELCTCLSGQLKENLSPNDYELVVDLRVAEFQGADDPLEVVAADRGLTRAEAEEALSMNTALMMGTMAMNPMACLGGIPNMGAIPGVPSQ